MRRLLAGLIVILLLLAGGFYFHQKNKPVVAPSVPLATVRLGVVAQQNVPLQVSSVGSILSPKTIMLKAKVSGEVVGIYFKGGQKVKKGQLLVKLNDTAQRAQLADQLANLRNFQRQYNRYKLLQQRSKGAVSIDDLTQKRAAVEVARAQVAAAKKALQDTVVRAPFTGWISTPQSLTTSVVASSQVASQVTQLAQGSYVQAGDALALLFASDDMMVQYQVPQSYSRYIKLGQTVSVQSSAYPRKTFSATVDYISPVVGETNQAYSMRALLHSQSLLRSGMNVFVTQIVVPKRMVLAVAADSLSPSINGFAAYMVEHGVVKSVPVVAGERFGSMVEIKSGLKEGDKIIVSGVGKVHPGSKVSVLP